MRTINRIKKHLKEGDIIGSVLRYFFERKGKFFVNTSLYNFVYIRRIKKQSRKLKLSSLNIENTNMCNAKCVFCPRQKLTRKLEVMDLALYKEIIDKIVKEKLDIKRININGFGEPLIDSFLPERIAYTKKNLPKITICFFTNGLLLNEETAKKVIKAGVDEINVSFNGRNKQEYKQIMGLDFDTTYKNVYNFIRIRDKLKSNARLFLSYVYLKKKDLNRFRKQFHFVDSIITMPAEKQNKKYKDIPYSKSNYKEKEWPCIRLWNTLFISVDGTVFLCCKDFNGEMVIGNLNKQSFGEIYKNFEKLRRLHLEGKFKEIPLCDECGALIQNSTLLW